MTMRRLSGLLAAPGRWMAARTAREQATIAAAAVVAAVAAGYSQLWMPLADARSAALADIARHERAIAHVLAAGPDLPRGPAGPALPAATVVATSAPAFGLAIQRVEPEGESTRVVLDSANFEDLLRWLVELEAKHALRVLAVELERRPEPGVVSARVTLGG